MVSKLLHTDSANQRNNEASEAADRLLSHARRSSADVPHQQYGTGSPQQRQLPQRNERKKPRGRPFFLSRDDPVPADDGVILTVVHVFKMVMTLVAEAELGALYINCRKAIPVHHQLEEMGHVQPPTPIQTDNTTALGVVNNTIQPRRTKAMDMRFHWLR